MLAAKPGWLKSYRGGTSGSLLAKLAACIGHLQVEVCTRASENIDWKQLVEWDTVAYDQT